MTANTALWALSLLLESLLLAALILRREASRLPRFTALIAFYLLRSTLLFVLFGRLDSSAYELTSEIFASIDLLLQIAVAWELLGASLRPSRNRITAFLALIVLSAAFAWLLSISLPASARTPVDRSVLFTSALMLGVFLAAAGRFGSTCTRRVLQGFAALGIAGILTQIERTVAASHRNAVAFIRWSWLEPAAYLAVLVFWLTMVAARGVSAGASARARPPILSGWPGWKSR